MRSLNNPQSRFHRWQQQLQLIRLFGFLFFCIIFHLLYLVRQSSIQSFYQQYISYPQFLYQLQYVSQNESLQSNLFITPSPLAPNTPVFVGVKYSICIVLYTLGQKYLAVLFYFTFLSQGINLVASLILLPLFCICPISSIMEIFYAYYYGYIFQHKYTLAPLLLLRCMLQVMDWISFVTTGLTLRNLLWMDIIGPRNNSNRTQPRVVVVEVEEELNEDSIAQVLLQTSNTEESSILLQLCVSLLHQVMQLKKQIEKLKQKPKVEALTVSQLHQRQLDLQEEQQHIQNVLQSKSPSKRVEEKSSPATTCVVCMDQEAIMILKPCCHECYCKNCFETIQDKELDVECPICRQTIESVALKSTPFIPFCEQVPSSQFHSLGQFHAQKEVAQLMNELKKNSTHYSQQLQTIPSVYRQVLFNE